MIEPIEAAHAPRERRWPAPVAKVEPLVGGRRRGREHLDLVAVAPRRLRPPAPRTRRCRRGRAAYGRDHQDAARVTSSSGSHSSIERASIPSSTSPATVVVEDILRGPRPRAPPRLVGPLRDEVEALLRALRVVSYMRPAPERSQCQRTTAASPFAITGVPASHASMIVREKLSSADGWRYASAAAKALSSSSSGRKPRSTTRPTRESGGGHRPGAHRDEREREVVAGDCVGERRRPALPTLRSLAAAGVEHEAPVDAVAAAKALRVVAGGH